VHAADSVAANTTVLATSAEVLGGGGGDVHAVLAWNGGGRYTAGNAAFPCCVASGGEAMWSTTIKSAARASSGGTGEPRYDSWTGTGRVAST